MEKKTEQVWTRLTLSLRIRLEKLIAGTELNRPDAIEEAIERFVTAGERNAGLFVEEARESKAARRAKGGHAALHDALDRVLESGGKDERSMVTGALGCAVKSIGGMVGPSGERPRKKGFG
jgi:hypothetical protein